jgi:alpha-D-xyloside xylohydrolase
LDLQYFAGENFETPKGRVIDEKIDHTWPDPPLAALPAGMTELNHFSARWEGHLVAPEDGEYELGLAADDGFRLFLNGEKLIEDWTNGAERYRSIKRTLRQGESVPVKIEFFQGTGNRVLRFAWRTPSELRALAAAQPGRDLTMSTYLPSGTDWYDFWTHQRHRGGQTVTREAPLDIIPLYVRAGSIIPMGPIVQYATERPDAPYEVRIYPGANGRFTVYEDDNETYDYENGQSARYELVWDDDRRTLSIGARQGAFPGMVARRTLDIVLAGAGNATAIEPAPASRSVIYSGEPITVSF